MSAIATTSQKSFTDQFTEVIAQIKENKHKIRNPPPQTYTPRYVYTGKVSRHKWKPITVDDLKNQDLNKDETDGADLEKRVKHCMLMSYSGANYVGMQRQKQWSIPTIERELLQAMVKNKWITEKAHRLPYLIDFQRASRTDKGVSAARQCCSVLLRKYMLEIECCRRSNRRYNILKKYVFYSFQLAVWTSTI